MVLEKFFLHWIDQESRVLRSEWCDNYKILQIKKTNKTRRSYVCVSYDRILVLLINFLLIKTNQNLKPFNIFGYDSLYTAYTTFLIRNTKSGIELLNVFNIFFVIFVISKSIKSKCEITGISNLKGFNVILYSLKCINLMNKTVKILECNFSYNRTLQQENNFKKHP